MTGRRYNDTVTVTCHEGSRYTGTSYRVCLRNGSWSGTDGFCENEGEKILLKFYHSLHPTSYTFCMYSQEV